MPRKPVNKPRPRVELKSTDEKEPKVDSRRPRHEEAEGNRVPLFTRIDMFLSNERTRISMGIILVGIALFLLIAYVSFYITGREDFSILEMSRAERIASRAEITNWVGLPGAYLSRFLIDGSYGIVSLVFIVMLGIYGLKMLKVSEVNGWRLFFCSVFWIIWGSLLLAFIQLNFHIPLYFRMGGAHGEWLAQWLGSYVQFVGTLLILTITIVVFLILSDKAFVPNMKRLGQWIASKFHKNEEETEQVEPDISIEEATESGSENIENATESGYSLEFSNGESITLSEPEEELKGNEDENGVDSQGFNLEFAAQNAEESAPSTEDAQQSCATNDREQGAGDNDDENGNGNEDEEKVGLEIEEVNEVETVEDTPEQRLAKLGPYDPRKDLENYHFPGLDLLKVYDNETAPVVDQSEQQANAARIVTTLRNFGIEIERITATVGPTVTLYEVVPKAGTRIAKIQQLENDIMLSLAAKGIRIIAPMPGKGTVGIEVPNVNPQTVSMHSVAASKRFQEDKKMRLPVAMGRTITNEVFMFDLAKTPHLLVAGATGQGKSVAINAIISSLLYKKHPAELKFVLVDPKKVEFAPYRPLMRHYMAAMPGVDEEKEIIITDCQKVINTLNSLVIEMENRYELLEDAGVRNLEDYNDKFIRRQLNPEKLVADKFHHRYLPYIVIIIDEYGDFIMQAGKQVELPIARITQKARAVGMHMILATQRPSVNIVTGVIKANIPTRIALRTQSVVDSRTVLDAKGAEQLVGKGDMLYAGNGEITRIQCAFIDTPEVDAIVEHIREQQHYFQPYQLPEYVPEGEDSGEPLAPGSVDMKRLDPMFADVARYVVTKQEGSTSRLQRAFEIGYNRAGKLSDQLEAAGIVGPNKGPKGRDVLIQDLDTLEELLQSLV